MNAVSVLKRLTNLRSIMDEKNFDAFFVSAPSNVSYMSKYTNLDSFLFICGNSCGAANIFITDCRYIEQARSECPDYDVILHRNGSPSLEELIASLCEKHKVGRLAFESNYTHYSLYQMISAALSKKIEFLPTERLIENFRLVKDEYEQSCLRIACERTDKVFADLCNFIRPGLSEREIEWKLLLAMREQGCDSGFPPIVVSGNRGSLPHGVASDKQVNDGEFVTMDFGCMYHGYHADMTRTVFVGRPTEEQKEIYDIVRGANAGAEALVKNGALACEVDAAARDYIIEAGYGEYFGHGVGHGVGLDIHESPFLNPTSEELLRMGCVMTIEPGIYLPGRLGVRIEDTVLVTEEGREVLFNSTKDLICL